MRELDDKKAKADRLETCCTAQGPAKSKACRGRSCEKEKADKARSDLDADLQKCGGTIEDCRTKKKQEKEDANKRASEARKEANDSKKAYHDAKDKETALKSEKDQTDDDYDYADKQKKDFEKKYEAAWDKAVQKGNYDPSYQIDKDGNMRHNDDVPKFAKDRLDQRIEKTKATTEDFEKKQKTRRDDDEAEADKMKKDKKNNLDKMEADEKEKYENSMWCKGRKLGGSKKICEDQWNKSKDKRQKDRSDEYDKLWDDSDGAKQYRKKKTEDEVESDEFKEKYLKDKNKYPDCGESSWGRYLAGGYRSDGATAKCKSDMAAYKDTDDAKNYKNEKSMCLTKKCRDKTKEDRQKADTQNQNVDNKKTQQKQQQKADNSNKTPDQKKADKDANHTTKQKQDDKKKLNDDDQKKQADKAKEKADAKKADEAKKKADAAERERQAQLKAKADKKKQLDRLNKKMADEKAKAALEAKKKREEKAAKQREFDKKMSQGKKLKYFHAPGSLQIHQASHRQLRARHSVTGVRERMAGGVFPAWKRMKRYEQRTRRFTDGKTKMQLMAEFSDQLQQGGGQLSLLSPAFNRFAFLHSATYGRLNSHSGCVSPFDALLSMLLNLRILGCKNVRDDDEGVNYWVLFALGIQIPVSGGVTMGEHMNEVNKGQDLDNFQR